jgi:hypothetical protein
MLTVLVHVQVHAWHQYGLAECLLEDLSMFDRKMAPSTRSLSSQEASHGSAMVASASARPYSRSGLKTMHSVPRVLHTPYWELKDVAEHQVKDLREGRERSKGMNMSSSL